MRLKPFLPLVVLVFSTVYANAQYLYGQDSVITTRYCDLRIVMPGGTSLWYAKHTPDYDPLMPTSTSDSQFKRDDEGFWKIDYSAFTKPSNDTIKAIVSEVFHGYKTTLQSAHTGRGKIDITVRVNSRGEFVNADITIWSEPIHYCQIPPVKLGELLSRLENELIFVVPDEYRAISDHYFHYSVFFKDL